MSTFLKHPNSCPEDQVSDLIRAPGLSGPLGFRLPAWLTFLFTLGIFYKIWASFNLLCASFYLGCASFCLDYASFCVTCASFYITSAPCPLPSASFCLACASFLSGWWSNSLSHLHSTLALPPHPTRALILLKNQNSFQLLFFFFSPLCLLRISLPQMALAKWLSRQIQRCSRGGKALSGAAEEPLVLWSIERQELFLVIAASRENLPAI